LIDRGCHRERAELARPLRRIGRALLQLGDPLLFEIPRLSPIRRTERFAMALTGRSVNYGTAWLRPEQILDARIVQFGGQISF
jgi:hypothetical protein